MPNAFALLSEAAFASALVSVLLVYEIPSRQRGKWLNATLVLFFVAFLSYEMWGQRSSVLQAFSVFLSVVLVSLCSLISFKLAFLSGLRRARSSVSGTVRSGDFSPDSMLHTTRNWVMVTGAIAGSFVAGLIFLLPRLYGLTIATVGFTVLLCTMLWNLRSDIPLTRPEARFKRDLSSLIILMLLSSSVFFVCWVWVLYEGHIGLAATLVLSSLVSVLIVVVLLRALGMSTQFKGRSDDPPRVLFMNAYWNFEKKIALFLFVFTLLFSDVPIFFLYSAEAGLLLGIYVLAWYYCLVGFIIAYTRQRTRLMIDNGCLSEAQIDAKVNQLASSYLA